MPNGGAKHTACRVGIVVQVQLRSGEWLSGRFLQRDGRGRVHLDVDGVHVRYAKDQLRRFVVR